MRNEIKNQFGITIGFSQEDASRIEYNVLGSRGCKVGYWDKRLNQYFSLIEGCVKSKSDIGSGHVFQVWAQYNK